LGPSLDRERGPLDKRGTWKATLKGQPAASNGEQHAKKQKENNHKREEGKEKIAGM